MIGSSFSCSFSSMIGSSFSSTMDPTSLSHASPEHSSTFSVLAFSGVMNFTFIGTFSPRASYPSGSKVSTSDIMSSILYSSYTFVGTNPRKTPKLLPLSSPRLPIYISRSLSIDSNFDNTSNMSSSCRRRSVTSNSEHILMSSFDILTMKGFAFFLTLSGTSEKLSSSRIIWFCWAHVSAFTKNLSSNSII